MNVSSNSDPFPSSEIKAVKNEQFSPQQPLPSQQQVHLYVQKGTTQLQEKDTISPSRAVTSPELTSSTSSDSLISIEEGTYKALDLRETGGSLESPTSQNERMLKKIKNALSGFMTATTIIPLSIGAGSGMLLGATAQWINKLTKSNAEGASNTEYVEKGFDLGIDIGSLGRFALIDLIQKHRNKTKEDRFVKEWQEVSNSIDNLQ